MLRLVLTRSWPMYSSSRRGRSDFSTTASSSRWFGGHQSIGFRSREPGGGGPDPAGAVHSWLKYTRCRTFVRIFASPHEPLHIFTRPGWRLAWPPEKHRRSQRPSVSSWVCARSPINVVRIDFRRPLVMRDRFLRPRRRFRHVQLCQVVVGCLVVRVDLQARSNCSSASACIPPSARARAKLTRAPTSSGRASERLFIDRNRIGQATGVAEQVAEEQEFLEIVRVVRRRSFPVPR